MYNFSNSLHYYNYDFRVFQNLDLTLAENRDVLTEIEEIFFLLQRSPSLLGNSPTSTYQWASHILDLIQQIRNTRKQIIPAIIINRDLLKFFLCKNSSNFEEAQQKLQEIMPELIKTTRRVIGERIQQFRNDLKHVIEHRPQQDLNGLTPDNLFS